MQVVLVSNQNNVEFYTRNIVFYHTM